MKRFNLGSVKITVSKDHRNSAMNLILVNQLSYRRTHITENMELEIFVRARDKDSFERIFKSENIDAEFGKSTGAIAVLARYQNRWGLIFGVLLLMSMVYLSSLFVWRIDISGNENVSDKEIISSLENSGFCLGSFIPSVDYDNIHNKFLMNSNDISWISINIRGSIATVHIKERQKENTESKATYSNVVASRDAQIATIQLYNGKKVISIGDVVKKGELLISGVVDSTALGVRYTNARGVVKGYVNKPIFIKIPLKSVKKEYTGKEFDEKSIKLFSKTINFSLKYRNYIGLCDKIETSQRLLLFGKIELPIEITTTRYLEYEAKDRIYSYREAVDAAFSCLKSEMSVMLENSELISKSITTSYDDDYFYINCNLYCLEDIAEVVEFDVE